MKRIKVNEVPIGLGMRHVSFECWGQDCLPLVADWSIKISDKLCIHENFPGTMCLKGNFYTSSLMVMSSPFFKYLLAKDSC